MNDLLKQMLALMPKSAQIAIIGLLLGGAAFAAHEIRYMTVADFTKSFILDLKSEVRALRRELSDDDLDPAARAILREQMEQLLDELCLEVNPDVEPYCRGRG